MCPPSTHAWHVCIHDVNHHRVFQLSALDTYVLGCGCINAQWPVLTLLFVVLCVVGAGVGLGAGRMRADSGTGAQQRHHHHHDVERGVLQRLMVCLSSPCHVRHLNASSLQQCFTWVESFIVTWPDGELSCCYKDNKVPAQVAAPPCHAWLPELTWNYWLLTAVCACSPSC